MKFKRSKEGGMTILQIQCLLGYLGFYKGTIDGIWGPLSAAATEAFQRAFGNLAVDGIPGTGTQEALIQSVSIGLPETGPDAFWTDITYFAPEEFMCQCWKGERSCDGWPHKIQPQLVQIADRARKHFGCPITIVSGLRCAKHNAAVGGVSNSQHMFGEAADIYVSGIHPDTVLSWFQSQSDVRYAYRIANSSNIHFDIAKHGRRESDIPPRTVTVEPREID